MASRTCCNSSSPGAPIEAGPTQETAASPNSSELLPVTSEGKHQLSHPNCVKPIARNGTATTASSPRGATTVPSGGTQMGMDRRLLKAAIIGDAVSMKDVVSPDPDVLLGTTPQGNTCLHISCIHGHKRFCMEALARNSSLLGAVNSDGETPLLTAVTSGHASLASDLVRHCRDHNLSETIILQQDRHSCNNSLHHAIRSGHRELALELIGYYPALSRAVNKYQESPMFMAAMRSYEDVVDKLLAVPDSAHGGAHDLNALHAAVRNGNSAMVKNIMKSPIRGNGMAREETECGRTPIHLALMWNKIDVLRLMLEHDPSLGYLVSSKEGAAPIISAASLGHVDAARELLRYCPDAPYCKENGWTCLHKAVWNEQVEFVEFIMHAPQLRKLVNMRGPDGETPLHLAVRKCNPKIVSALLFHKDRDVTVLNNRGDPATWELADATDHAKTLNWNEVSMLMLKADPQLVTSIHNLHKQVKDKVTDSTRKDIKSLTETYTGKTSLVATLIAAITFAAAFKLPEGYNTGSANEDPPIMVRKLVFQAFLISDTLAMCSSLAVAFICIIARWEDLEFLLYYRSFTKKLMWFAYMATTTAFATGLYPVLAPCFLWLAIPVFILMVLSPILTKLLGEWPIFKLRVRLGRTFKSELLDMV